MQDAGATIFCLMSAEQFAKQLRLQVIVALGQMAGDVSIDSSERLLASAAVLAATEEVIGEPDGALQVLVDGLGLGEE